MKKDNKKIVEIILSGSGSMSLKNSCIKDNKIIDLRVDFTVGDLSKVDDYIVSLPKSIYEETITCDFKEKMLELNNCIDNDYYVRIWSSHYDVNSYLLLLYICNYLNEKANNIIVLYSNEYKKECYSPGTMTSQELEKLVEYEHSLSKSDIDLLSKEWNKIKSENSDLRIIENGKIKSVDFNYFDNEMLTILNSKENISITELAYEFSCKYHLSATIFIYLITQLINNKKIIILKNNENFIKSIIQGVDSNV